VLLFESKLTDSLTKFLMRAVPSRSIVKRSFVHWQSVLYILVCVCIAMPAQAQDTTAVIDSTNIFGSVEPAPQERSKHEKVLEMIVTAGGGVYQTFRETDPGVFIYKRLIQPTASVDFYLEPGGIGFILGGHFGYADYFTQGISFGIREKLGLLSYDAFDTYTEISVLFFDDKAFARSFETGVRLALSSVFPQNGYGLTLRLAGEYRGRMSPPGHDNKLKPLYWVGLEGGINFSLLTNPDALSRKDSLRAGLRHILTSAELSEFDNTSASDIDRWYDRYWTQKDVTPNTPRNEAREEFESRVRVANEQFSRLRRLGVDTDRGRLIVVYGKPNYIESAQREGGAGTQSYQLWVYENRVRGYQGAVFLFESGYSGEYKQIYSNVTGEISGMIPYTIPLRIYQIIDRYR
jgi:GWxTD domain-containing protein